MAATPLAEARRGLVELVNAEGEDWGHVALGVAVCVGAVAAGALIAARYAPTDDHPDVKRVYDRLEQPRFKPPAGVFKAVWPALFSMLTWSGLRVWNAERTTERTRAFWLWSAIQGLNALWMAWSPRHRGAQLLTALTTFGVTALYVTQARKVDPRAAAMVAPYAGWIGFANILTEEVWRKNRGKTPDGHTIH